MSENMKIGLINIQRCDSHGAVLLAYALEKIVRDLGFDVWNIDYKYAGRIVERNWIKKYYRISKIILKKRLHLTYARKKILGCSLKKEYDVQHDRFEKFRNEFLNLTNEIVDPHDKLLQRFDGFIVGSDVVWKPEIAACEDKEIYFLKSAPDNAVKIAYAASIGTDDKSLLCKYEDCYKNAFDNFDYISIREQSMIGFVKKFTDKDIVSLIDPVFLLSPEEYTKLEKNSRGDNDNADYIYVYTIGDNETAILEADKLAKKWNCRILLDVNDGFANSKKISVEAESAISAGPAEFIYNIRRAKYVITDSFHATAFSLLYNIPFCVFDRGKISVRMNDILKRFNIGDRRYSGFLNLDDIDWEAVNTQISRERKNGIDYIKGALENVKRRKGS